MPGILGEKEIDRLGGDRVQLDVMVFERQQTPAKPAALIYAGGATCDIRYEFDYRPFRDCWRSPIDGDGTMRSTPARRLQGAQLLAGRFRPVAGEQFDLALMDICMPGEPLVLVGQPSQSAKYWSYRPEKELSSALPSMRRYAQCDPIDDPKVGQLSIEMIEANKKRSASR